jgi:hypothetical protein
MLHTTHSETTFRFSDANDQWDSTDCLSDHFSVLMLTYEMAKLGKKSGPNIW